MKMRWSSLKIPAGSVPLDAAVLSIGEPSTVVFDDGSEVHATAIAVSASVVPRRTVRRGKIRMGARSVSMRVRPAGHRRKSLHENGTGEPTPPATPPRLPWLDH